jgi:peptidoglycan/LPS O-acetylase OafA/YrhL
LRRIAALDGLRGVLALIVVLGHAVEQLAAAGIGGQAIDTAATFLGNLGGMAVCAFFMMSAHVLTRSWDGRFLIFLVRRLVRLWPTYALCLGAGFLLIQQTPDWSAFVWYPIVSSPADPPGWSLCVEAQAMLFMPGIVWCATGPRWRLAAGALAWFGLTMLHAKFWLGACFLGGAALSTFEPRSMMLETAAAQWLGKLSYSLYLSHWLVMSAAVMAFGPLGVIAAVPVALLVAQALWWAVERPSMALSRRFAWPRTPRLPKSLAFPERSGISPRLGT